MFRRRRKPSLDDLPKAHQIVLVLLAELNDGGPVTWEELRAAAAEKGIGERELHVIMHGVPPAEGA